jgi:hemerythrin
LSISSSGRLRLADWDFRHRKAFLQRNPRLIAADRTGDCTEPDLSLLTWNHDYAVGVRAMDDQHGILMDTMNDLRLAIVRGAGQEKICELLRVLTDFARMHFANEERMLADSHYPGLEPHQAEHREMLARLLRACERLEHGEPMAMKPLLASLRAGFIEHIASYDRQYGEWMNERGIL